MKTNSMKENLFTYTTYMDGVFFAHKKAKDEQDAIAQADEQRKNLHPLNMSDEGAKEYRKRFENCLITAKKLY